MQKKIAIFCDGTWNQLRTGHLTNVAKLAKCVAPEDVSGVPQIVFYDEGVGVGANVSRVVDKLVAWIGGAFGRGLDRKVEAAYRFLVLNYEPDDEIYVFGFSRGAYTARSLCGLIRKCGIVRRDCFDQVPTAVQLYRDQAHPKDPHVVSFRQQFSHARTTGEEDDWVAAEAQEPLPHSDAHPRAQLFQYRARLSYRMMYLGVWDTVGSLGVPAALGLLRFLNAKYRFHDTSASTLISSLRHAVAIEEPRRDFDVAPVDNIDELNTRWAMATNWNVDDPRDPRFVPYNHRPYQQVWFPGHHTNVGGGFDQTGLSSATLLWIAEGARDAGLAFRNDPLNELWRASQTVDPMEEWYDRKGRRVPRPDHRGWWRFAGFITRRGPRRVDEIGLPATIRWGCNPAWRPTNLGVLALSDCETFALPAAPSGFPTASGDFPPPWTYAMPSPRPVAIAAPPPAAPLPEPSDVTKRRLEKIREQAPKAVVFRPAEPSSAPAPRSDADAPADVAPASGRTRPSSSDDPKPT